MAPKKLESRPSQLSEEFVQDTSDDDDESDGNVASESALEPGDPGERPGPSEKEEEEDDDDDDSSNFEERVDDSGGDRSHASSGSKKRPRESEPSAETPQLSKRPRKSDKDATIRIPAKPFKPPPGFEPIVLDASDYAAVSTEAFSNLSGKQVWQISAPASVNVSLIKQFDIAAVLKGEPIFTDNNVSYMMQPTADSTDVLLLPQGVNASYKPTKPTISRGFSLQVIEKKPSSNIPSSDLPSGPIENEIVFTAQAEGTTKPPREQPVGLKTRYSPYGVIASDGMIETKPNSRKVNGLASGALSPTKINRTPSKPKRAIPASESTSWDTNEDASATRRLNDSSPKAAEPLAFDSSLLQSSGNKKKKKRSKLVDNPGL